MRRDRLVAIGGPGGPGSGYVVGPRLVLTSAHVVTRRGALVQVFRPGAETVAGGVVVWCGTPGGRDDAALVHLDDELWRPPSGTGVRWGRLVTERPGQACETWGVPDVVQRPGAAVEAAQLVGAVNPGSGFVGNRYVMNLVQHPPAWPVDGTSPWGGLSGAAMFCGRLLTGVVAADPGHFAHAALTVVPAYVLYHDADFRAALAEYGAGSMTLEAVEFQELANVDPVTVSSGPVSAAALLQPGRQIVGFHGREELLGRLIAWCRQEGFGSRLLHGSAGQGKTRLAQELAAALTGDGWAVLWPRADALPTELRAVRAAAKPLLVVLDYAETRAAQLAALLEAAAEHGGATPFKVLLLARTAGDWWTSAQAVNRAAEELLDGTQVVVLPPLQSDVAARAEAYRRAADAFAAALSAVRGWQGHDWPALAAGLVPGALDRADMDNALTLHMTVLADLLDAADPGPDQPASGLADGVEDRLLLHERRYWERSAATHGLSPALSTHTLDDALAAALLIGAATHDDADEVLHKVAGLADQPRDRRDAVLAWIAALYPPTESGPWGTLQPDRLAERLIGRRLEADPTLAHRLVPGIAATQATRLLAQYSRAAAHPVFEGRLDTSLAELCVEHRAVLAPTVLDTATRVEHPGPLIAALHRITDDPGTPLDVLRQLSDQVPGSRRLAVWACDLARQLADRYRNLPRRSSAQAAELVWTLNILSLRLSDLDRREEAVAPAEEAVALARTLADTASDADVAPLIASLNGLAGRLGNLGRWEEALAAAQEAVTLARGLADTDTDIHLPDLVGSLNTLSDRLADLGRREEALAAAEEAVRLRRRAKGGTPSDIRQFARTLTVYSDRLWALGRQNEAMEATMETGRLYLSRRAADTDIPTDAGTGTDDRVLHHPGYIAALNDFATKAAAMGRVDIALSVTEQVVRISRDMAKALPDAYLPQLAESLGRLAWPLEDLGRPDEALAASEEAVSIVRGLVAVHPEAHLLELYGCLSTVAAQYAALGRREEALANSAEGVRVLRGLAAAYPDVHQRHLATGLLTLATRLVALGREEQALAATEEAVRIRRALVSSAAPGDHLSDLASGLVSLGLRLGKAGRPEAAHAATEEAVALYRALAETDPDTHLPKLATGMYALSRSLEALRRWDEALAAVKEAFRLRPELASYDLAASRQKTAGRRAFE